MKNYERLALGTYLRDYEHSNDFQEVLHWVREGVEDKYLLPFMYQGVNKSYLCDRIEKLAMKIKHLPEDDDNIIYKFYE